MDSESLGSIPNYSIPEIVGRMTSTEAALLSATLLFRGARRAAKDR
jgi:hypothetical protein